MNHDLQEREIRVDFEDDYEGRKPKVGKSEGSGDFGKPGIPTIRKIILGVSAAVIVASTVVSGLVYFSAEETPDDFPTLPIDGVGLASPIATAQLAPFDFGAEPVWTEHFCTRTRTTFSLARNQHFMGWIQLGESRINEPVVQKTEEQYIAAGLTSRFYYLNRTFDGRTGSDLGTIFVDRFTPIVDSRRPHNTVLYGHNLPNLPTRKFAFAVNYYTNFATTYRDFPTIQFTTIYSDPDDYRNTYLIFAGNYVNTEWQDGHVFDYFRRRYFDDDQRWGDSRSEFFDFMGNVMDRSVFLTGIDVEHGDEILTLSTCHRPLDRLGTRVNSRFALYARRVRPGEDITELLAQSQAVARMNPSPLYFDEFYNRMGGSWDGRGWDTDLVPGFAQWLSEQSDWCSTRPRIG